jgi:type I restriction enzyme, S subunit
MNVLLSIKPEYVEKILSGEKRYEFRKRIWKKKVNRVFIYAISPVKKIVASFTPGEIVEGPPEALWKHFHSKSGTTEKEFMNYFINSKSGYAIEVTDLTPSVKCNSPSDFSKGFAVPQSFNYVQDDDFFLEREVSVNG